MSEVLNYKKLALDWQPKSIVSDHFKWITLVVFLAVIIFAVTISSIKVPEPERRQIAKVPDRIANFIAERPKKVKPPAPKPEPKPKLIPRKKPDQQPIQQQPANVRVERPRQLEKTQKSLNADEQKARNVAQQSGLLALAGEMSELTDTSEINKSIRAKVRTSSEETNIARHDDAQILAVNTSSDVVIDDSNITVKVDETALQERDSKVHTTAATERAENEKARIAANTQGSGSGGRAPEDITKVFDKNKPGLYSLYDRERRKDSSLKGRVVFQLTILPNGKVADVKVISSDLNNPALESRIMSRIKLFMFTPTSGELVTLTYPVEFLP
jgi:TonB family protein